MHPHGALYHGCETAWLRRVCLSVLNADHNVRPVLNNLDDYLKSNSSLNTSVVITATQLMVAGLSNIFFVAVS